MGKIKILFCSLAFSFGIIFVSCSKNDDDNEKNKSLSLLPAPDNLSASGANNTITLTWNSVSGASSYNLFWDNVSSIDNTDTAITSITNDNYTHINLDNGSTYYYKVAAVNDNGTGSLSSEASAVLSANIMGSETNNGHTYALTSTTMNWQAAADAAEAVGGYLAILNTLEENEWLYEKFGTYGGTNRDLWIGALDNVTEGSWYWYTGTTSGDGGITDNISTGATWPDGSSKWASGEPNNAGNEDVVELLNNGKWNDHQMTQRRQYVVEVSGAPLTASVEEGTLTLTPAPNWNGEFMLELVAMDTSNASDTVSVSGVVHPVNDVPLLADILDQVMDEDETLRLAVDAEDIDGDFLELSSVLTEDHHDAPIDLFPYAEGDSLLIVPGANWNGYAEILVSISDGESSDEDVFGLTVNPVDDDPFITGYIEDVYVYEDFVEPWEADLNELFEDIDGPLSFSVEFSDAIIGHSLEEGILNLYSMADMNGVTEMVVTAYNPVRRSTVSDDVMVTVFAVNDAPVLGMLEGIVGQEDESVELSSMVSLHEDGTISDVDDGVYDLDYTITSSSDMVSVDWNNDPDTDPVLIPEENYHGSSVLTLCVSDGEFEECDQVDVLFESVNDDPFFTGEMESPVGRDLDFHVELEFEDVDHSSDDMTLSISSGPDWVSVEGNSLVGNASVDLGHYEVVLHLNDTEDTTVDTFHLHVENFMPEITSITDVPDDQGGHVYVTFNPSFFDDGETNGQSYSLFRHDEFENDSSGWVALSSIDAVGNEEYSFEIIESGGGYQFLTKNIFSRLKRCHF